MDHVAEPSSSEADTHQRFFLQRPLRDDDEPAFGRYLRQINADG